MNFVSALKAVLLIAVGVILGIGYSFQTDVPQIPPAEANTHQELNSQKIETTTKINETVNPNSTAITPEKIILNLKAKITSLLKENRDLAKDLKNSKHRSKRKRKPKKHGGDPTLETEAVVESQKNIRYMDYLPSRSYRNYRDYRAYQTIFKNSNGSRTVCAENPYDFLCFGTEAHCRVEPTSSECLGTRSQCLNTKKTTLYAKGR